ncbi:hypothetical protein AX769_02420 [Frondihabitans sp. PAMC 28766]|uniref:DUF3060 domain-containing protein n=1 Tax=Frondihabitans sp. PAMC 28766 TaxID=1795630 RepID=UPI00078D7FC3|nr:DUF3060 domain-containing protein [Frondihabitans sp. PAMC 28766]AMM19195.1 hypothetical protein AX769_02420 [Frondihabitans sp. PAMC 28766]
MRQKIIVGLAAVIALTGVLAGCTTDKTDTKPTTTPTAKNDASKGQPDDVCVDGIAYMDLGNGASKTLKDKCDTVIVIGDKGTLHVGDVKTLSLMGNGNTIDAGTIGTLDQSANDNKVTYKGAAPKLVGDGTGNAASGK